MKKLIVTISHAFILGVVAGLPQVILPAVVLAQTTTCSRIGNGYSCYDYGRHSFQDITPNGSGGYNTYDYGTSTFGTVRPTPGGGFETYTYPNGRNNGGFGTLPPLPGLPGMGE